MPLRYLRWTQHDDNNDFAGNLFMYGLVYRTAGN